MNITQIARNLYGQAAENIKTYPRRNEQMMNRAVAGEGEALNNLLMALPMLTVSTKGAGVAKKALECSKLAKKIHPEDLLEMSDFTGYARNPKTFGAMKNPYQYEASIRDMAQHYGINPEMANVRLANEFTKILDLAWKGVQGYLRK
jgi:hypothetical protein